jgi:uncharacterized Zn finger protein (UPF0148 family)
MASNIQSETAQIGGTAPNIANILSGLISEIKNVTASGTNVGALTGCEAYYIAVAAETVFSDFMPLYSNIGKTLFGRKRAAADGPELVELQSAIIDLVNTLYTIVNCSTLATLNSDVDQVLQDASNTVTKAGGIATSYSPVCGPATAMVTSTTGTRTVLTSTYVTTCPICTGTHVVPVTTSNGTVIPATTITKATTITTTYCPESGTTMFVTTYVTTCPICTGTHVVPETKYSGSVIPGTTLTKATTLTETITVCPTCEYTTVPTTQTAVKTTSAIATAPVSVETSSDARSWTASHLSVFLAVLVYILFI